MSVVGSHVYLSILIRRRMISYEIRGLKSHLCHAQWDAILSRAHWKEYHVLWITTYSTQLSPSTMLGGTEISLKACLDKMPSDFFTTMHC